MLIKTINVMLNDLLRYLVMSRKGIKKGIFLIPKSDKNVKFANGKLDFMLGISKRSPLSLTLTPVFSVLRLDYVVFNYTFKVSE